MKTLKFLVAFVLLASVLNCTVDIPDSDTELPNFSFRITGDGFDHTFTQDDDFDHIQLNLREDAEYDFILTGSDQGGTKFIDWQYSPDYCTFLEPIPSTWSQTVFNNINAVIRWDGDRNNPISGTILTGRFRIEGDFVFSSFDFRVADWGGTSGTSNVRYITLNLHSADHRTEIRRF